MPAREIHDLEGAIAECRHQQPLADEIDGHMIDPPADSHQILLQRTGNANPALPADI